MSLLSNWNDAQADLKQAIMVMLQNKQQPPADAVELLKTQKLKDALQLADQAEKDGNVDAAREAQSKSQKFFLVYANQFKAAMVATEKPPFEDLHDALMTFNVFMTRTQVGVVALATAVIKAAKEAEGDNAKKLLLDVKSALSPLRLKYDWKAGKADFERETGKKKPSEKIMGTFRLSAGLDNALDALDKACLDADVKAYRKAYPTFVQASADYVKTLKAAIAKDKTADDVYTKKCEGLKDLLSSIGGRAKEKLTLLDNLGV